MLLLMLILDIDKREKEKVHSSICFIASNKKDGREVAKKGELAVGNGRQSVQICLFLHTVNCHSSVRWLI